MIHQNVLSAPEKIVPNSFQAPNFLIDECMPYLNGNETKCVVLVARKTFGWLKSSARISRSQIMTQTGLSGNTVEKAMTALVKFGVVLKLSENNVNNEGIEWALQTNRDLIRFDLMMRVSNHAS